MGDEQKTPTTEQVRAYLRATGKTLVELRRERDWPALVLVWARELPQA